MKKQNKSGKYFLAVCIILLTASCAITHNVNSSKTDVTVLIQEQNFKFAADRVIAQNGFTQNLTSNYSLTLSPDSLVAWLPYFGRAYRAPMDPAKGGIEFTSTDFTYNVDSSKKDEWRINIIPQDHKNAVDHLTLHIFSSGTANLTVISTHRQPVTFYGKIKNR